MNTDDDYILLIDTEVLPKLEEALKANKYIFGERYFSKLTPLEAYPSYEAIEDARNTVFRSYRKGEINVILTASPEYYENFVKATLLAKQLNLINKNDRINLFHSVCTDNWPLYHSLILKGTF